MPDLPEQLTSNQEYIQTPVIGVVAGVGPYAGLDLLYKIADQTVATADQDHLPVLSISRPVDIPDRTAYLLGEADHNPAEPILAQLDLLAGTAATVAGIPCNTAHAPPIFDVIEAGVAEMDRPLRLLHMIREVGAFMQATLPGLRRVGVLSTIGTARVGLYPGILGPLGYEVVVPETAVQENTVHPAVYDPDYGIKACGRATDQARHNLEQGIAHLKARGAEAMVLGCTEMPLAFSESTWNGLPLIDPALILARALIRETYPSQLRP